MRPARTGIVDTSTRSARDAGHPTAGALATTQEDVRARGHAHRGFKKLRAAFDWVEQLPLQLNPQVPWLVNVTTLWLTDETYRDEAGMALRLPLYARGRCLSKLIRRAAPKADVVESAKYLVRTGAVRQYGRLYELVSRFVCLRTDIATYMLLTIRNFRWYLDTVEHNMRCQEGDTRIERNVLNVRVPESQAPEVRRYIDREVTNFCKRLDAFLSQCESSQDSRLKTMTMGLGFYAIERRNGSTPGDRRAVASGTARAPTGARGRL